MRSSQGVLPVMSLIGLFLTCSSALFAQQEIGFIEKFALANDRREVLKELIPGTEDYYYYHCLHYQNEKQLAEAQAVLDQWKARFGENAGVSRMVARQLLLSYDKSSDETIEYLRQRLGVSLTHAPPSRDRAATLTTQLDPQQFTPQKLIDEAVARDRSLSQVATGTLPQLVDIKFAPDQLRAWLGRLDRADFAGLVRRIAEELTLKDSPGFGWAGVHRRLTLAQLDELSKLVPDLWERNAFVQAYLQRLAPLDDADRDDPQVQRAYIERLLPVVRRLPGSQNSLKALVIGNLLRVNMREGKWDRGLFLEYLALPRQAPYYAIERLQNQPVTLVDLNFSMEPQVSLPPIQDDSWLVERSLQHYFQADDKLDDFARYLNRETLDRVLAETKILYGLGETATWYAKLSPEQQKALRERIELRFAPTNKTRYSPEEAVRLALEVKNVPQLLIKIYEINPRNYYRMSGGPLSTDIDLDGLIANAERKLEFSQPAERRHDEAIELPELKGRGVWVVDLLGAGGRCRTLIQKGSLSSLQSLSDSGHVLQIIDEAGRPVKSAYVEINNRAFPSDSKGRIYIPYSESNRFEKILLVDGSFAVQETLVLQRESYQLEAGFIIDRQNLVAGKQAVLLARVRLLCNGQPTSLKLIESPALTITAQDIDGVSTSQTIRGIMLDDAGELKHQFLVPQRLAQIEFRLAGQVLNQSRDEREPVAAAQSIACNLDLATQEIGNFYLREVDEGYRLLVLGRNGEPLAKLPVTLALSFLDVTGTKSVTLATNARGEIELGPMPRVATVQASAQGVRANTFPLERTLRAWPAALYLASGQSLRLPLGTDTEKSTNFSLIELRREAAYRDASKSLKVNAGVLEIQELAEGRYELRDHHRQVSVPIHVIRTVATPTTHLVGATRTSEIRQRQPLLIQSIRVEADDVRVKLEGVDEFTRVQVIAHPFVPSLNPIDQAVFAFPSAMQSERRYPKSFAIDSLKLDEEYSYILQRQQVTKYPGNMLPQPSLLVHPWEISLTNNESKDAKKGEALPKIAAPAAPAAAADPRSSSLFDGNGPFAPGYDFLAEGTLVAANIKPSTAANSSGEVVIPRDTLKGYSSLSILAVHPTTVDSRRIALPATEIAKRDLRLKQSFDPNVHLAEVEAVRTLKAGEKIALGDARTSRVQVYTTLGDVYQLYGTLLKSSEWEKFQFLTEWPTLSDEQKRVRYGEMSCHELDYFLYRKDRAFFEAVVAPLVAQKLDKQLVDLWLLDKSLDGYRSLWRIDRLNTLERLLLARKIDGALAGTTRWLDETVALHPMDPAARSQRFAVALRGKALSEDGYVENEVMQERLGRANFARDSVAEPRSRAASPQLQQLSRKEADGAMGMAGGMAGGMGGAAGKPMNVPGAARAPSRGRVADEKLAAGIEAKTSSAEGETSKEQADKQAAAKDYFGADRRAGVELRSEERFYRSLDQTRELAETQFHKIRLDQQTPALVPPSEFWRELLAHGSEPGFLSRNLDLPVSNVNEALLALASIDLPWSSAAPELTVENDRLYVKTADAAIAYVQTIEPTRASDEASSILVGQDIYLANPNTDEESNRPVGSQPLLKGTPYRVTVVVTNPTSSAKRVQVLNQLPAGAMPLASSKFTRSTPVALNAYSTGQVAATFYFPNEGEFAHYGGQVSSEGKHLVATASSKLRVLAEPETVDETTWSYIADWGSSEQVIAFLKKANLQKLDLSRIAFRMQDKAFYEQVISLVKVAQRFEPNLWGYALKHKDPQNIAELLQHRPDFSAPLGPAIDSPLLMLDPREQMSYEHLDYKPLVVARIHQLGTSRVILNNKLMVQYNHLMNVIAHERAIDDDQRMEMVYYLLLQNRIGEALDWFGRVDVERLATRLQYDYFDAYLDFYRGRHQRAAQIANRYANYPVPRWREMFGQVIQQVRERDAISSGQEITSVASTDSGLDRDDPLRAERREIQQTRLAAEAPALDLAVVDGVATVQYRNLHEVQVHYYLMDIELLFSRNPFVSQSSDRLPAIQPNYSQQLAINGNAGSKQLELPPEVRNRNVLVEVTSQGITRSSVITANSLAVTVSEPFGRLQVQSRSDRAPIDTAYVKVYARHQDGSVRFFKDGYTDLRGQFDYASLSTGDLNTAQRLSILVIDPQRGALVREVAPPTR